ncbi:probable proteasome subunit beta type-2 [Anastrepha obliqua]|uniref:probable proteasome subunit beta type-2 n=1 Tax=Anastrepha ludens TaxID=28586 RepID=UPI0023AE81FE|nr:probable proteasome subunit beta type-2 [Anastrepha ludens]XP_054744844.1 probable proteasome subunit beta type-2 [Anastrepha obliqua]
METILGIRGDDFAIVAADTTQARSIVVMKEDEIKIHKISDSLVFATMGESGDTVKFTEFISKNIALYKMRNNYELSPKEAAHFTRKNLSDYLRSRTPYQVNMMIAGYDEKSQKSALYFIDYLANSVEVKYSGQGYGAMFCQSIFDREYKKGLNKDEAYKILEHCVKEIQKRLVINQKNFKVSIVNKDGVASMPDIRAKIECN